jgi:hypothetical protein
VLDAGAIIAEAEAQTGVKDPETQFQPNLEALVASLNNDGTLSARGEPGVHRHLVDRAVERLEAVRWVHDFPEIAGEIIADPVFLCGLPRSGTTYFQYLFDHDPRFRLIRTWESITPSPPPGYDAASVVKRKAEEQEKRRAAMDGGIEGFDALHLMDVDGPDECHAFLEHSYGGAGFQNLYDVPTYFDYLMDRLDFVATYQVHKRQLQLLQWRMGQPRWAVKYPNHVIAMKEIMAVHPTARFVMTHRDPVQTLASICKMTLTLRRVRYDSVDPHRVGAQMRHFIQRHIDRIMEFARSPGEDRVTHVDYYRVADNPAAVIEEVHESLGIETPPEVRNAVADWREQNPKGARGVNAYSIEQFGLNADEIAEQYGDYMRYFDIPREHEGVKRGAA